MKTTCAKLEPDLLMHVHGELQGWQKARVGAHLLVCAECRARRRRMDVLTGSLAAAFRNPSLGTRTFASARRTTWMSLGLGAGVFSMLGWIVSANFATGPIPPPPATTPCATVRSCDTARTLVPKASEKAKPVETTKTAVMPIHKCGR
jgi:anti-sigma factor RsiW